MTGEDAVLALKAKLRAAHAVMADFTARQVPHQYPVALTIEEAAAIVALTDAAPIWVLCPVCEGRVRRDDCGVCNGYGFVSADRADAIKAYPRWGEAAA